jgi:hypothetical protein
MAGNSDSSQLLISSEDSGCRWIFSLQTLTMRTRSEPGQWDWWVDSGGSRGPRVELPSNLLE